MTIKSFNVLDPQENLEGNILLEASAGTGKTFSIENIVVRFLIEEQPLRLDEILVVTFTRAATRDLKERIRKNIENILNGKFHPEYLLGKDESFFRQKLNEALLNFDEAQIYTIHAFCSLMLQENVLEGDVVPNAIGDDPLPRSEMIRVIRDFFRTEVRRGRYLESELQIVMKSHMNSIDKLENTLLNTISKGLEVEKQSSYVECFQKLNKLLDEEKEEFLSYIKKYRDFAVSYKGICNAQQVMKDEYISLLEGSKEVFCKKQIDDHDYAYLLENYQKLFLDIQEENRKVKVTNLGDLEKFEQLGIKLKSSLDSILSPIFIFARMAYDCQQLMDRYLNEEEKFGYDQLLVAMVKAIKNKEFKKRVQNRFLAAIIDEFQDTDSLQWEIFRELFLDSKQLKIVGDPKQSIYAFRLADIYTYIQASEKIDYIASLDTNYRSQPSLVHALNCLFDPNRIPDLFQLPKLGRSITYRKVNKCDQIVQKDFSDDLGSIHFMVTEDLKATKVNLERLEKEFYLPFLVQEISRLREKDQVQFRSMAILVSDRFQADRIAAYLKKYDIPAVKQRSASLIDSPVLGAFQELFDLFLNPKDESALKVALGGKILRYTLEDMKDLQDVNRLEEVLKKVYVLRLKLYEEGFSSFFQNLMESKWHDDEKSVAQCLLESEDEGSFFRDLNQLAEIVIEFQCRSHVTPEGIYLYLQQLGGGDSAEEEKFKVHVDPQLDAVNILTMHASKGLEYEVVFALGLIKRTKQPEMMIPVGSKLVPIVNESDVSYKEYCSELDAEKMRQLYVAMTRAKYRLYLPLAKISDSAIPDIGTASPMELYIQLFGSDLLSFIDQSDASITYSVLNEMKFLFSGHKETDEVILVSHALPKIVGEECYMHSFTSLSKKHMLSSGSAPHDFLCEFKNPFNLPAGAEVGVLLHEIFEKIDFTNCNVEEEVDLRVRGGLFDPWREVLVQMVEDTLSKEILPGFALRDLSDQDCYRETEFLMQHDDEGYLKGVIDMLFSWEGKYYLLDWKSNWLGSDIECYGQDQMRTAMEENEYFLQAKLYQDALRKYFALVDSKPFEELFGGVFYIFLRGISNERDDTGVYYFQS